MKIKEYFSHDIDASNDPQLSAMVGEFKAPGYGVYWRTVEMLHKEGGWLPLTSVTYKAIARSIACDEDFVKQVIECCIKDFKLFRKKNKKFTSERVLKNLEKRDVEKTAKSIAGRASAKKRWGEQDGNTTVTESNTPVTAVTNVVTESNSPVTEHNKEKERKEKERKEEEIVPFDQLRINSAQDDRGKEIVRLINFFKLELLNDRHFLQQSAISWYLDEKHIPKMIDDFAAQQTSLEKQWPDYHAFKAHFFSWGKYNNRYLDYQPKPKQMVD